MAVQLFILRGVPDDEAQDVRDLLADNAIDFYETPAGNWGLSMPALWLKDETQLAFARRLIDEYECKRTIRVRAAYDRERNGGRRTLFGEVRARPFRFIVYMAIIAAILYFSTKPFLSFGR